MSDENTPAYIGRDKCGCVIAAIVDDGTDNKSVGEAVAEFISNGLTIERSSVGYVRANWGCKHKPIQLSLEQAGGEARP